MDGVTRPALLVGEGFYPLGQPLSVVVQHDLGHCLLAFEDAYDPNISNDP